MQVAEITGKEHRFFREEVVAYKIRRKKNRGYF